MAFPRVGICSYAQSIGKRPKGAVHAVLGVDRRARGLTSPKSAPPRRGFVTAVADRAKQILVFRNPWESVGVFLLIGVLVGGCLIRLHFGRLLDPFEDGYQHWWIAANLLETGEYWDRHSMMTQGNWLPLYHFFSAGILAIAGIHNHFSLIVANIALSALTTVLVFRLARREGITVALLAAGLFAVNFIDTIVSGWSVAESLGTFLLVLGYGFLFVWRLPRDRHLWIAASAFALAVLTRYEIWLLSAFLLLYVLLRPIDGIPRKTRLLVVLPAVAVMASYFVYALQWGFLPEIVVRQTSTDIRFQVAAGTQPSVASILGTWWTGYVLFFPLVLVAGGGYALRNIRREFAAWILVTLWGFVLVYSAFRFGNPSFRYVMPSVPFLSLMAAFGLKRAVYWAAPKVPRWTMRLRIGAPQALAIGACVMFASTAYTVADWWDRPFPSRELTVPLLRAGEFLRDRPLPPDRILISESPIAAFYSGYSPSQILGSRWLPADRTSALAFLKAEAEYVVYFGVPYYPLRLLFPEMQNGISSPDFELLFDAGAREIGTHATFVYRVVR